MHSGMECIVQRRLDIMSLRITYKILHYQSTIGGSVFAESANAEGLCTLPPSGTPQMIGLQTVTLSFEEFLMVVEYKVLQHLLTRQKLTLQWLTGNAKALGYYLHFY